MTALSMGPIVNAQSESGNASIAGTVIDSNGAAIPSATVIVPATLLYGSNAIGGVVYGISTNDVYQKGLSGCLTTFGGTSNWTAGVSSGFKFGVGDFLIFGNAGAQKANNYHTPEGTVLNSFVRTGNVIAFYQPNLSDPYTPLNHWGTYTISVGALLHVYATCGRQFECS